jgi:hypothetical protein
MSDTVSSRGEEIDPVRAEVLLVARELFDDLCNYDGYGATVFVPKIRQLLFEHGLKAKELDPFSRSKETDRWLDAAARFDCAKQYFKLLVEGDANPLTVVPKIRRLLREAHRRPDDLAGRVGGRLFVDGDAVNSYLAEALGKVRSMPGKPKSKRAPARRRRAE